MLIEEHETHNMGEIESIHEIRDREIPTCTQIVSIMSFSTFTLTTGFSYCQYLIDFFCILSKSKCVWEIEWFHLFQLLSTSLVVFNCVVQGSP